MEDYYEYLDSNGVTTLYKLIKDDTVALIDSYSVTINGITTTLDTHINNTDIHTPISDIESMVDTKISGLVNSAPETLDTLKELSDALGNDPNFATTVANLIGNKANSIHTHVVKDITDFPTIPTKVSELSNDSNFVTSTELHDYATKNDLNSKQDALSEEQLSNIDSIPDKANKSDLSNVATSGSYKDLLDKPVIPEGADLSDYYNKDETDNLLNSKANTSDLAVVAKSGNYNDLINTPTIPTKTSQLINDSGFLTSSSGVITSVSWSDIKDKPNFATVATSGSYTDLSNTPTIPTKVSQLENDMGFGTGGDTSDCVHKTGNETINGTKTFTSGPVASNSATTNGYSIKNTAIARNEVPTQLYHATFRAYDKNGKILGEYCVEKSTTGCTLAQINVRSEDSNGKQLSESLYLNMSNDGSTVRFHPSSNNKMDLGMPNNKWAKVYSDDIVHTSGDETINGVKTFTSTPFVSGGGTTTGIYIKNTAIARNEVPSTTHYSVLRTLDKNNKILGDYVVSKTDKGATNAQINIRSEDSNGNQIINAVNFSMSNDGSSVSLAPSVNNKVNLGTSAYKWANAYIDRVVCTRFTHSVNNGSVYITGGSEYDKGATLVLHGEESNDAGTFIINSRDKTRSLYLVGKPDGTLQWAGQNIALDSNLVHKTGNETIAGAKTFTDKIISNKELQYTDTKYDWSDTSINTWCDAGHVAWFDKTGRRMHELVGANGGVWRKACYINENQYFSVDSNRNISYWGTATFNGNTIFTQDMIFKNNNIDLTVTPSSILYSNFIFKDKNDQNVCFIQYAKRNTDPDVLGLYIHDKDKNLHGIQITSNNYLLPMGNNIYNLGSPSNKWSKVYSDDIVHTSGNETISGTKYFNNDLYTYGNMFIKNNAIDLTVTPSTTNFNQYLFRDKNNVTTAYLQFAQQSDGNVLGTYVKDKSGNLYGVRVNTLKQFLPFGDNTYSLGSSSMRWGNVYATTLNGTVHSTTANAFMAQCGGYTCTLRNDGSNTYLLMSAKDGTPGTWTDARPLQINNSTGVCSINGHADSATYADTATKSSYLDNYSVPGMNKIYLDWDKQVKGYVGLKVDNSVMGGLITTNNIGSQSVSSASYSPTPATTDNSTRIATTAWVRTYVNSVAGSNSVGSSVSAYWSNSSDVTATGQTSSGGYYPECYSDYITKTPTVGTIYSGAQLYTVLNTSASATGNPIGSSSGYIYFTNNKAQATFSNPINASGKYLCTTANTVKFRAYTARGSSSAVGTSSVVNATLTKSIFIRVE